MRIFFKILIVIGIILLVFSAIGLLFFSSHIHVEKSITINKSPDIVFNYVNNLDNWNNWSPWYKLDPSAKYTMTGPHSGAGAKLSWESDNSKVGKGSMTITEVKPNELIKEDLNFMENGIAKSYYAFAPEAGGGTKVSWGFDVEAGANPLMRIMGAFMDDMVGEDFNKGLNSLKQNLEAMPVAAPDSTRRI